jgi:hypothetical protein
MLLFEVLFLLQIKPKTVMFYRLSASVIQVKPLSHERRTDEIEFAAWTSMLRVRRALRDDACQASEPREIVCPNAGSPRSVLDDHSEQLKDGDD